MDSLFERFADTLRAMEPLREDASLPAQLLLAEDGPLRVFYAPFDSVNLSAKVVLVSLTPDPQQARDAINAAGEHLRAGADDEEAAWRAKAAANFFAARRDELAKRLDLIGLNSELGLDSCEQLFTERQDLIHLTSMLRYPVMVEDKGYAGLPNAFRCAMLRRQFDRYFTREALELARAWFIPLDRAVAKALQILVTDGVLEERQVIDVVPASIEDVSGEHIRVPYDVRSARATVHAAMSARLGRLRNLGRAG